MFKNSSNRLTPQNDLSYIQSFIKLLAHVFSKLLIVFLSFKLVSTYFFDMFSIRDMSFIQAKSSYEYNFPLIQLI